MKSFRDSREKPPTAKCNSKGCGLGALGEYGQRAKKLTGVLEEAARKQGALTQGVYSLRRVLWPTSKLRSDRNSFVASGCKEEVLVAAGELRGPWAQVLSGSQTLGATAWAGTWQGPTQPHLTRYTRSRLTQRGPQKSHALHMDSCFFLIPPYIAGTSHKKVFWREQEYSRMVQITHYRWKPSCPCPPTSTETSQGMQNAWNSAWFMVYMCPHVLRDGISVTGHLPRKEQGS